MTNISVPTMKRLIFAGAICVAIFGGASTPSSAADLGPVLAPGANHLKNLVALLELARPMCLGRLLLPLRLARIRLPLSVG